MPNVGRFISDEEVLSFARTLHEQDEIGGEDPAKVIIEAAEDVLETELSRDLTRKTHTDERHIIEPGTRWQSFVVNPVEYIRLNNYPVDAGQDITLKLIHSRDEDNEILESTTIKRNRYTLKDISGIIRLYSSSFQAFDSSLAYLSRYSGYQSIGPYEVLCTYTAGYYTVENPVPDGETVDREFLFPSQLKLFLLQYISRVHRMMKDGYWSLQQIRSQIGQDTIIRTGLTPEEKMLLQKFRRPVLG